NVPPPSKTAASEEARSRRTQGAGVTIASGGRKTDLLQEVGGEGAPDFCRNFMTKPQQSDLARGADSKALARYFNVKELKHGLKVRRESGAERVYEEDKKTANELLTWLTTIKAESVLKDLDDILEEHFDAQEHMSDSEIIPGTDVKAKWCEHWTA